MRMIWKKTTLVGFGKRDKVVVAWYCTDAATVTDASAAKDNVGENCIDGTDGFNKCYIDVALKAVNDYRKIHLAGPLSIVNDKSGLLQKAMDDPAFAGTITEDPLCSNLVYEETDDAKLATLTTTAEATDKMYKYKDLYDYDAGAAKKPTDKAKTDLFAAMVWNSAT